MTAVLQRVICDYPGCDGLHYYDGPAQQRLQEEFAYSRRERSPQVLNESQQEQSSGSWKKSASGHQGIYRNSKNGAGVTAWRAFAVDNQGGRGRKIVYIGLFPTIEAAKAAQEQYYKTGLKQVRPGKSQ